MNLPTYSIVIPAYKRVFGFREALDSALAVDGCQEVLVLDDNSDHDEFRMIVEATGNPKARYIRNAENQGLFGNWNRGVQLASGEFVSVLCSDDLIAPDAFQQFAQAYRKDPHLDVFFGPFCTFSDTIESVKTKRTYPAGPMASLDLITDAVRNGPAFPVLHISRRSKLLEHPFVARPHSGNDWLWIYANATALRLHATDRPINYWRRHPDQDAVTSQAVTTDCWPLMFLKIATQLRDKRHPLEAAARRRAKGVVLSWLLNDFRSQSSYLRRLRSPDARSNLFLHAALDLIGGDWLLSKLLDAGPNERFYYNIGRVLRKIEYYPAS